jgi:uncharacterized protein (TIGR03437 family)
MSLQQNLALVLGAAFFCHPAISQTVTFQTNLGNINVTLRPDVAPITVQNFLKYVNRGSFNNSFFHRSVAGFIIQGGGYQFTTSPVAIPADPAIQNEFNISNTRGTLAMALLGTNPNSATTQWFFNLADNSANLDNQNGGFTVFGQIADNAGLAVMDQIAAVPVYNEGSPFDMIPLQSYSGSGAFGLSNLALVTSIAISGPAPVIQDNGVASAGSFGGFASAAPGSYIEIFGSNFSATTRGWKASDFIAGRAPTSLDGVSVTVDGKSAFVNFVSPTQVNVEAPDDVTVGGTVPVVVIYGGQPSDPAMLAINAIEGGLLAPPSFNVNGRQYAAAVHQTTGAYVSNGSIPNVAAAPAVPGETLVFYGIGFGPVTFGTVAGLMARGTIGVKATVQFQFGDATAQVLYAGLAPGLVGVYQFNVVVPAGVSSGDVPLTVQVNGSQIPQTLFVPVRTAGN